MLATTCQAIADTRARFIFKNTVKIWVCKNHIKKASVILFRLFEISWKECTQKELVGKSFFQNFGSQGPGRAQPRRELKGSALKPNFGWFCDIYEAQDGLNVLDGLPL